VIKIGGNEAQPLGLLSATTRLVPGST